MERKRVLEAVKILNEKLEKKISYFVKQGELERLFLEAIDEMPDNAAKALPDEVKKVYNDLMDEAEGEVVPMTSAKSNAKKNAKVPKKPKTGTETKRAPAAGRDKFGFRIGSKGNLFVEAVLAKPGITMAEVQQLPWNKRHATYWGYAHKLAEMRYLVNDGGKLSISTSPTRGKNGKS